MKKLLLVILSLTLCAGLWAQEKITLTAANFTGTINAGTETTVDGTEGKVSWEWETTDEITVTDKDQKTAVYSIESIDKTTGRATFVYKSGNTLGEGPYTATYGTEPAKVQTYSKTPGKIYMTAPETSTNSFNFTVQCALMEINLTKSVYVSSVAVTGTPTDGTETTYILACIVAPWIKYKTSFYIAVPAGVYNKIVITDDDGKVCTLTEASGITVANNHIKPLAYEGDELDFIAPSGVKEDAIKELKKKQQDAWNGMNIIQMGFESTEEVRQVTEPGREKIVSAKVIAINNINEATDESTIRKEKDDCLKVMEEEAQKTLEGIPNAIARYRERMKSDINNFATDANNKIDSLDAPETPKNQAKNNINNVVFTAKTNINNAKDQSDVEKAIKTAKIDINQQLANVAISGVEQAAATAKEEIDGLDVDESDKSAAKTQIDNIVNTATATINDATNKTWTSWTSEINEAKDKIYEATTQAANEINNVVKNLKWITVRTDAVAGNWNTICLERDITDIDGATFWTVSGQDANSFVLDEVTEPQAGQGYLIRFTKSDLRVIYGDQVAATPVTASYDNPIQGTFTQIDFDQDGKNVLVGNYVVYNNQLCPVEAWVGMKDHRAYVVADLVSNTVPQQAPSRARAYMPKPDQTPTEIESVDGSQRTIRNGKFLRNGQLIIVKDNKMYNVQGMKL